MGLSPRVLRAVALLQSLSSLRKTAAFEQALSDLNGQLRGMSSVEADQYYVEVDRARRAATAVFSEPTPMNPPVAVERPRAAEADEELVEWGG